MTAGPLPDFLVIGAMKAGTTSLHHYLQAHPDLFLPRTKELNFFRDEEHFARGERWYRAQFADARPDQVCGEVSPDYTKHPHHAGAPARIARTCPDVRLVYVLRHPVDRMMSMYLHQVVAGRESRPADVALLADPEYLESSSYAMQLERHLEHVEVDRVLLESAEDLASDRDAVLRRIHAFVGVRPDAGLGQVPESKWYQGSQRRRRGRLAAAAAESPAVRGVFERLPDPVRAAVRRMGTTPVDDGVRTLSDDVRRALEDRLRPDLERLRPYAPSLVDRWGLL